MKPVEQIHPACQHSTEQKQPISQKHTSAVFGEMQRNLDNRITQLLVRYPLVSDEQRDAEHHARQHDNESTPPQHRCHPELQVLRGVECGIALVERRQRTPFFDREPLRDMLLKHFSPLIFGTCKPDRIRQERPQNLECIVPSDGGGDG